jgi:hypothetical protein
MVFVATFCGAKLQGGTNILAPFFVIIGKMT